MDTTERRWARLAAHMLDLSPEGPGPHPTVLLFHGCGGVRAHIHAYAAAAVRAGWRVLVMDSYGPRGWSRRLAQFTVCTGLMFRAKARAGDIVAALWGARRLAGVDTGCIALTGWSHGSWALMDLMTARLTGQPRLGLSDPDSRDVDAVRGLFLAYPYVGLVARSWRKPWLRRPRVFGVIPTQDHLARVGAYMRAFAAPVRAGCDVELWGVEATHAFDEPGIRARLPIRYDEAASLMALDRFQDFLSRLAESRPRRPARQPEPSEPL